MCGYGGGGDSPPVTRNLLRRLGSLLGPPSKPVSLPFSAHTNNILTIVVVVVIIVIIIVVLVVVGPNGLV